MNKAIVEEREYGKTTYLFHELMKAKEKGKEIYVMDSATEHPDKSLIRKVEREYSNVITLDERDQNKIVLNDIGIHSFISHYQNYFPFEEIVNHMNHILCFDLSYFLEKGHEMYDKYGDIKLYQYYRSLYNHLSEQIALSLILSDQCGIIHNGFVFTDEIEFPVSNYNIGDYQENIEFFSSVHPENAFGTFYNSFEKVKIKRYNK